jgi:transposase
MELETYYKLISSESRARKYLLGKCFKNHQRICPRCCCRKLYKLREGRYRCSRCDYTFQDFSGRWINRGRLSAVQWLSLIKLFELEVSVRKMSLQLGLSYRAVYGAVSAIRMAILSHAEDASTLLGGEIELDEAYFGGRRKGNRGRGAAGKVPVFADTDT